jgi:hypothetical protein
MLRTVFHGVTPKLLTYSTTRPNGNARICDEIIQCDSAEIVMQQALPNIISFFP